MKQIVLFHLPFPVGHYDQIGYVDDAEGYTESPLSKQYAQFALKVAEYIQPNYFLIDRIPPGFTNCFFDEETGDDDILVFGSWTKDGRSIPVSMVDSEDGSTSFSNMEGLASGIVSLIVFKGFPIFERRRLMKLIPAIHKRTFNFVGLYKAMKDMEDKLKR